MRPERSWGDPDHAALAPRLSLTPRLLLGLLLCAGPAAYAGFRLFWFLTDDAYIAFRYASNALLGHGLVWNPAPFTPVEGYTSFLWTVLLLTAWKLTGLPPPDTANALSFTCACATLALVVWHHARMSWPRALERARLPCLALVLLGTLSNRTFLAWMSSGLETALVNLLLTAWLLMALASRERGRHAALLGVSAALLALTRPDGLLFVGFTLPLLALRALEARRVDRATGVALLALGLVPAHLVFRYITYGALLPNTYYAKHVAAWPESGLRYATAFGIEYGVWVLFPVLAAALVPWLRFARSHPSLLAYLRARYHVLLAVGALLLHFAYYTWVIGGDHFEFRVYSHLVPLLFVACAWLGAWLSTRGAVAVSVLALFVAMSWPIPWVHWWKSQAYTTRQAASFLIVPVADDVPLVMRPLAQRWDALEAWLIPHYVGMRHQEHKVFYQHLRETFPDRAKGARIAWRERAVVAASTVGMLGWVLPHVAVIDELGLNNRIIAHNPVPPSTERRMAHDRYPPAGYVECFEPNVSKRPPIRWVTRPLSDERIRACERRFAQQVGLLPL